MASVLDDYGLFVLHKLSPCLDCGNIAKCKRYERVNEQAKKEKIAVTIIDCKRHKAMTDQRYENLTKELKEIKY